MIIAVAGSFGVGKTQWIAGQIRQTQGKKVYFSPQTHTFPLDALLLQSEFPELKVLLEISAEELGQMEGSDTSIYIELPWYLDLSGCEAWLQRLGCHRVALVAAGQERAPWQTWADELILKDFAEPSGGDEKLHIHRAVLTGEVLDGASLETVWLELTRGAYGNVRRAKGIFAIAEGHYIYGEWRQGGEEKELATLNIPLSLQGRPTGFSGLEVVADTSFARTALVESLRDSFLGEQAIAYYQQQIKASLELEKE